MSISMNPVANFHQLSIDEAKKVLDNLQKVCEPKEILLSRRGNDLGVFSHFDRLGLEEQKTGNLFDVAVVQRIFAQLDNVVQPSQNPRKICKNPEVVEKLFKFFPKADLYIQEGAVIAAMIIKGYSADFTMGRFSYPVVSCSYQAELKQH